jgi:hypothetical protein
MNIVRIIFLTIVISLAGQPVPVLAQNSQEFALPVATAGKLYRVNLAAVLRETYRLKIETDSQTSVLRWAFAEGEVPPGLAFRANGTITGIPRQPRSEPYRFHLSVRELKADSQALKLNFILTIMPRVVRLTPISAPRLSPVEARESAESGSSTGVGRPHSSLLQGPDQGRAEQTSNSGYMTQQSTLSTYAAPLVTNPSSVSMKSQPSVQTLVQPRSELTADSSYDAALIKPVLSTLRNSAAGPYPLPLPSPKPDVVVDVSKEVLSGDKIRGPATIELKNLNIVRYDIRVGKDVTFPPPPNLKLPFIPPIPTQPQSPAVAPVAAAGGVVGDPITAQFNVAVAKLNALEGEKALEVNGTIVRAIAAVNLASDALESLVTASDSILATGGGPSAIVMQVTSLTAAGGEIDTALTQTWPDAKIENLLGRLEIIKNDLLTLPTNTMGGNWTTWYATNKSSYDSILARVSELQTQLAGLKSSSTQGTAFKDAQKKLRAWKPILIGVRDGGTQGFNRTVKVGCGFAFDTGKETKVKIIKTDRWAEPGTAPTNEEVVTVVCSSPLSVSAGFGFSNVDEREFVFVPSTKTVTGANGQTSEVVISRFGFKNRSSFRTLPVLLLNTRIWEPNDTFALHVSTGAAVDVKTGQGGTDLEYIVGPSISFWRSLFVTPGLHIGRVPKLVGGFQLDQEVPTGISEPPIEKAWKKGFVTTFTYKIR